MALDWRPHEGWLRWDGRTLAVTAAILVALGLTACRVAASPIRWPDVPPRPQYLLLDDSVSSNVWVCAPLVVQVPGRTHLCLPIRAVRRLILQHRQG